MPPFARDFDNTEPKTAPPEPPVDSVSTEPYSTAFSEADRARLEVLTGAREWIDVTHEDMKAARQLQNEL